MKKVILFAAAFLLFTSCSLLSDAHDLFFEDTSLTIENNTEKAVRFVYIDRDTDPEFPITLEPGTSRNIDLSAKYEDYNFKFVYDGITYRDGFYPCGKDVTIRLYEDSDSRVMMDFGSGNGWHPNVDE